MTVELRWQGTEHNPESKEHPFLRLEAIGRLSREGVPSRTDPLQDIAGAEVYAQDVLLGLEKCASIDSSGVGWLLQCNSRFQEGGGRLVVHSAKPLVLRLLRMMRMQAVLNIAASAEDAKQMIQNTEGNHHGNGR
jgi:anti-anti-sigma factor